MAPTLSNLAQVHARESVFYVNGKRAHATAPELSLNEYIRQHTPYKVCSSLVCSRICV